MKGPRSKAKGVSRKVGRGIWLFCLIMSAAVLGLLATNDALGQTCTEPPPDMISWWPGDGNPNDIQSGNDGTLQNGATFAAGMVGQAFSFDGVDDYVQIPHNANLDPGTSSFSLDAWVKTTKATGSQVVVSKYECGQTCISNVSNSLYLLAVIDGKPYAVLRDTDSGDSQNLFGVTFIADGNFHHLAMVRDMAAGELRLYADGVLDASAPLNASATGAIKDDDGEPDPFLIGAFIRGGTTTRERFFSGLIDEVEFYNRALSDSEIQAIFDAGSAGKCRTCTPPPPDMTGWWPGDGNTYDIVGGRNAVLHGDATTEAGLVGDGFVLDGDGDFVDVPHGPALNLGTGDFTVDLWVFFNDTAGEQVLVEKWIQRFDPNASEGWTLTKLDGNVLLLAMADGSGPEIGVATDVLEIAPGTWTHFAATRQGDLITIYMNGVPVAEGTASLNLDSESSLKFGHRGTVSDTPGSEQSDEEGFFLNGRIDEVELFVGRALSDAEILSIADAGNGGKCKELVFSGFFQPIDNNVPNSAKAGQTIPIKWRLTDANGIPISDPSSFVSVTSSPTPGSCGGSADAIETYAGSSGLQYLGDGYWQFNWKTPTAYAGQCRTMSLNLNDGASGRTAAFKFK